MKLVNKELQQQINKFIAEAYLETSETSKMELFAKTVNGIQPLTMSGWSSILDIWRGSKYVSVSG